MILDPLTPPELRPCVAPAAQPWPARLELGYARQGERTVVVRRLHHGPLRVQRSLYPEGKDTCHSIILHPPGGIAGGDQLALDVRVGAHAAAVLTTPGASKWYRGGGRAASQRVTIELAAGASLEWLPQESILFDGADAELSARVQLEHDSLYLGWEILCLGRRASGERFERGRVRLANEIWQQRRCLWIERGDFVGGDALLRSPVGLAGHAVCATLIAAGRQPDAAGLAACRAEPAADPGHRARAGVSQLPGVLLVRWLGDCAEQARRYLVRLWSLLRPLLRARAAHPLRIWAT